MRDIVFGIGCLTPVPKGLSRLEATAARRGWLEDLEPALGAITSATNIDIKITGISARVPSGSEILPLDRADNLDFLPQPSRGSWVRFDLVIPRRMHLELCPWWGEKRIVGERFAVHIMYRDYGPVTFVRCLDQDVQHGQSAWSVALVREFLKSELGRANANVDLWSVGPSPFWAHFKATAAKTASEIDCNWITYVGVGIDGTIVPN